MIPYLLPPAVKSEILEKWFAAPLNPNWAVSFRRYALESEPSDTRFMIMNDLEEAQDMAKETFGKVGA